MAAKKPIKKKKQIIRTTSGAVLVADYDGPPFTELYNTWRDACKDISRSDLFMEMAPVENLLMAVSQAGVISRQYPADGAPSPKNAGQGGTKIIKTLDAIAAKKNDLSDSQLPFLKGLIEELKSHEVAGSETNPRNIVFSDPIINTKGSITRTRTVYGHYRTLKYQLWRSKKVDKKTKKGQKVPRCPSSWYSYDKDTAEPPMWQAFYAPTENNKPLQSRGLLPIIDEYYEAVKDLTYSGRRENPARITSRTIAKDLYETFPEIRAEVAEWVKEGSPFLKTNLSLYGKQASDSLKTIEIKAEGLAEIELFEQILNLQKLDIDVDSIFINVTPLQCTRMASMNKDYADRLKNRTYEQRVAVNRRKQSQAAKDEVSRKQGKQTQKGKN